MCATYNVGGRNVSNYISRWGMCIVITCALAAPAAFSATPVFMKERYRGDWTKDRAYIDKLVHDDNPQYEANKRLVLSFEAALEHAQSVKDGEPGDFDAVVAKYLSADYVQYDPMFPPGRDGLLGFFKMVQQSGEKVSHPPVMMVAQGDLVVLTMMRPPVPEPHDASKTYTAYRIAIWKVCGTKLCAHWGPDLKER